MSHLQAVCGTGCPRLQVIKASLHQCAMDWNRVSSTMQFKGLLLIKIYFVNVCNTKIVALFVNGMDTYAFTISPLCFSSRWAFRLQLF